MNPGQFMRKIMILMALGAVTACGQLPGAAAVQQEIVAGRNAAEADFAVYQVTRDFLPTVADWPVVGETPRSWLPASGGPRTQVIATGDVLRVTIWDSNENSLLTGDAERSIPIEALSVQPDGTIFLPYVGDAEVSGMTVQVARQMLQDELEAVVPSAQVQLEITSGRTNSVDLVGGVGAPGNYPLPDRNYSILNLIAQGGGVAPTLTNPQIKLIRGHQLYATSVSRLFSNPGLNTLLRGGDQVLVEDDDRSFLSLGAAGTQSQHTFPSDTVSALDAVSIIGGVSAQRGNPGGVLVLREYPRAAVTPAATGPDQDRVVFTLDLTTTDGLFSARNFAINDGDVVLVTEAPITRVQTILGLVGSAFGLTQQVGNIGD